MSDTSGRGKQNRTTDKRSVTSDLKQKHSTDKRGNMSDGNPKRAVAPALRSLQNLYEPGQCDT